MPGNAPVCFVVAMRSEAEPLIQELGLARWQVGEGPFPLFRSDDAALVVSGVGKVAAGAAATYLFARLGGPTHAGWINVGIAGHRWRGLGEAVLAHKVTDAGSGRSWQQLLAFEPPVATSEVVTVEEVERSYAGDAVYDMEAAGFVAAAERLANAELIQVLKVVSDNATTPVDGVDRARIRACIGDRMAELKALRDSVRELAGELAAVEAKDASGSGGDREVLVRSSRRWRKR